MFGFYFFLNDGLFCRCMLFWFGIQCQLLDDGICCKGCLGYYSLLLDLEERVKDNLNYIFLLYCIIEMMYVNVYVFGFFVKIKLDVY